MECPSNSLRDFSVLFLVNANAFIGTTQNNWQDTQRVYLDAANNTWLRIGDGAGSNATILRVINYTNGAGDSFTPYLFRLTTN